MVDICGGTAAIFITDSKRDILL